MSKDYVKEFEEIVEKVLSIKDGPIESRFSVIDRGIPHSPNDLEEGTIGVYAFLYNDEFLKIGKAGSGSNPRFKHQHYNPKSSNSNLSKSILNDEAMNNIGLTEDTVGEWIKNNTRRIDILLDSELGEYAIALVEAALHYKYPPRYEGN